MWEFAASLLYFPQFVAFFLGPEFLSVAEIDPQLACCAPGLAGRDHVGYGLVAGTILTTKNKNYKQIYLIQCSTDPSIYTSIALTLVI